MVLMMAEINRANFGGRQVVTCSHVPSRDRSSRGHTESVDAVRRPACRKSRTSIAQAPAAPSVEQVLDTTSRRLAARSGSPPSPASSPSERAWGHDPEGDKRPFEVVCESSGSADHDHAYARRRQHHGLRRPRRLDRGATSAVRTLLAIAGHELDGLKLDADLSFPARIKEALG